MSKKSEADGLTFLGESFSTIKERGPCTKAFVRSAGSGFLLELVCFDESICEGREPWIGVLRLNSDGLGIEEKDPWVTDWRGETAKEVIDKAEALALKITARAAKQVGA